MAAAINILEKLCEDYGWEWRISHARNATTGKIDYECAIWKKRKDGISKDMVRDSSSTMGEAIIRAIVKLEVKYGKQR